MRRGDEGGMEEGTTGLRGVASSARGGHTCVAAGRWRVDDRPPWTTPVGKCSKEAVADEGVAVAPRPPQDAVSYVVGGACSRRREAIERVLAAPVRILVFTPADEVGWSYWAKWNYRRIRPLAATSSHVSQEQGLRRISDGARGGLGVGPVRREPRTCRSRERGQHGQLAAPTVAAPT